MISYYYREGEPQNNRGRHDRMVVELTTTYMYMQSVHITTKFVSSNPAHGEVCSIQNYVRKFVSDLRQVGGFLWILRFPPQEN